MRAVGRDRAWYCWRGTRCGGPGNVGSSRAWYELPWPGCVCFGNRVCAVSWVALGGRNAEEITDEFVV